MVTVREDLDETQLDDSVGYDIQPGAFYVKEQQRSLEV